MASPATTDPVNHGSVDRRSRQVPRIGAFRVALLLFLAFALFGCGGGVTTTESQPGTTPPETGSATISWASPSTNVDGTPLTSLAGYKVYYGLAPGVFSSVDVGNTNSYHLGGLTKGRTYYFAVTAYDSNGNESDYSSIVSKLIS